MPCSSARARQLLRAGKAAVFRRYPFTLILKRRSGGDNQPVSFNVDPGSKETGVAITLHGKNANKVVFAMHLVHRGHQIKDALEGRRAVRRARRHRKTRYRPARFLNRTRPAGWLAPSLMSRVHNVTSWANRLSKLTPITQANVETVRFDTQLLENPTMTGIEYQRGTLFGFELREFLLQRHHHQCAYCGGLSQDRILNIEHIMPKALGGTDRVGNLVIACKTCNEHKHATHPQAWADQCSKRNNKLDQKRADTMPRILKGLRPSLRDAAAVNATRYAVGQAIQSLIPNTAFWSGGRTKKNRTSQGFDKDHWTDAACVGVQGESVVLDVNRVLIAKAQGHGSRQMCRMDRFGFPRTSPKQHRSVKGFKTGDMVCAMVPTGKKQGVYTGRVAVRSSGSFNITDRAVVQGISHRYCRKIHSSDGYHYQHKKIANNLNGGSERLAAARLCAIPPRPEEAGFLAHI